MWATTVVTITKNDFPASGQSFSKDGVTVSAGNIEGTLGNLKNGGSFSTTLGNFTQIEVTAADVHSMSGDGWSGNFQKMTWTGNASSVSFSGDIMGMGQETTLKFTIEESQQTTYTLQLVADPEKGSVAVTNLLGSDIIDNGNGNYTVPANAEVTILATPLEGFEFTGWKTGNIEEMVGCYYCGTAVNTEDNPYTFTMTADVAYLAEFEAVAPATMFNLAYEDKWLKVNPTDGEGQYFVFVEDKVYYDNRYTQYDQTTMQNYLDYVVGVVVGMSAQSNFVFSGEKDIDPDPIYHTWYDNDHLLINHDYVAFVFKFENDARVGDVEYLAFTYAGEPQGIDSTPADVKTVKIIRDGQVLIIKNGKTYNALGAEVR